MGNVGTSLSMSLDGFIAGPNSSPDNPLGDAGEPLFQWYFSGDTDYTMPSGQMTIKVSPASAEMPREAHSTFGALVTGRKTFDITHGWGGRHPMDVPVFVVTHSVPQEWLKEESPFTFVTAGVESAVAQAKEVAGDKNVGVGAASMVQQCLKAGLLDEIQVELVPVLLGKGIRMFEYLGVEPVELERTMVVEAPGVTHLRFRVVKQK
ncbi:MAG: dihydrofolate reductase family protein [Thermomicrobiales bacterium]